MSQKKNVSRSVQIFCNMLIHLDDYIKFMRERKSHINFSKNISSVLKEVITSKVCLKYFFEQDLYSSTKKGHLIQSKSLNEETKNYIKKINPLGFNQKNLE